MQNYVPEVINKVIVKVFNLKSKTNEKRLIEQQETEIMNKVGIMKYVDLNVKN